jgi:hypothetical protein
MEKVARTLEGDVTGWYPPSIPPMRVGVYERDMEGSGNGAYSYWNGKFWCGWGFTIDIAHRNGIEEYRSSVQDADWRGLAVAP